MLSSAYFNDECITEGERHHTQYLHSINTRNRTDRYRSDIVGAVLLPRTGGRRLAVADKRNSCVKIVDLETRKLTGKVELLSRPIDITVIGEDQLAVTLHKQRHLQLLRASPRLVRSITLPLPGRDYGTLTCRGDKLYMVCWDPRSIQIFRFNGIQLQEINNLNNVGNRLFKYPQCIAVSPDEKHIYISDWFHRQVSCFTPEGIEVWRFSRRWWMPRRMDVDDQGNLFICSLCSPFDHPIALLSSAGRMRTLQHREYRGSSLWTVAVGEGRLYLGSDDNDVIDVFSVQAAD